MKYFTANDLTYSLTTRLHLMVNHKLLIPVKFRTITNNKAVMIQFSIRKKPFFTQQEQTEQAI